MSFHRILTACVLLFAFAVSADEPAKATGDARTLRVMSYNIHTGRGVDGKLDLARIAKVIKSADVDVVAVQEVDVDSRRTDRKDEPAELARLTGMHVVFGKAIDHDGGRYGQVILSRQPITDVHVHKLPSDPDQEQRIAVVATIPQPRPLPDLIFIGTHLHHSDEKRRLPQADELIRFLKDDATRPEPAVILAGDLNSTPDSTVMQHFFDTWIDTTANSGFTIPAEKPAHKIDYVLVPKGNRWEVISAKVLDEPVASDHRPVVVELNWKNN